MTTAELLENIGTATIGLLMVAYLIGLPVTGIVAAAHWHSRTRGAPLATGPAVDPAPPADAGQPDAALAGEADLGAGQVREHQSERRDRHRHRQ